MKICAVGLRGLPGVMGGIEQGAERRYPRMLAQHPDLEIWVLGRKPYLPGGRQVYKGINVVPLWSWRNRHFEALLHTLLAILYARFVIRPDILHVHAIGPGLLCPLARSLGMSVVLTHHGTDYDRQKWGRIAKMVLRLGEAAGIAYSNYTIVVGRSLSEDIRRRFPKYSDRIKYIPNGAPERSVNEAGRIGEDDGPSRFGLAPGDYILAVGRLVPEKGFQDLIRAFNVADLQTKLVIVGGADHPDSFVCELQKNASDSIIFTGFLSGELLHSLQRQAALFVHPSYHEGLPNAVLEAISAGLPILLSDIEPHRDIGLPERCYFPTGDLKTLAMKLRESDYRFYKCDPEDVLSEFDWSKIAQQTVDIYLKIANEKVRGRG